MNNSVFETLSNINMTEALTQKEGAKDKKTGKAKILDYIAWAEAWRQLKTKYPEASYSIWRDEDGLPYIETPGGLMVFTSVTVEGLTLEMHLPVLNYRNEAVNPEQFSIVDVNKALMRCLVKNIAMHGLGINVYIGEEFSESENTEISEKEKRQKASEGKKQEAEARLAQLITEQKLDENKTKAGLNLISNPSAQQYAAAVKSLEDYIAKNYDLSCWR